MEELGVLELQDKIPSKAHTIFVGINPAIRSAQVGHYYAHPTNKFWTLVRESGLAPDALDASHDDLLVKQGFGFTDVAKRPTAAANDVTGAEFEGAPDRITQIVKRIKPRTLVFVSKKAARAFLNVPDHHPIRYGKQRRKLGNTTIWFLPSTSGQSYADGDYPSKLRQFRRLVKHVGTYR